MTQPIIWSHSTWKVFDQCPRQYHLDKVLKLYPAKQTQSLAFGNEVHKAFENYLRDGTPMPTPYDKFLPWADKIKQIEGTLLVESYMAFTHEGKKCKWKAEDVWWRGVADAAVLNQVRGIAWVTDWKSSKNAKYADKDQLELIALAIFAAHPKINKVKAMLAFVVSNEVVQETYYRKDFGLMLSKWQGKLARISACHASGTWNPKPGPLCPWCPVEETRCEYKD